MLCCMSHHFIDDKIEQERAAHRVLTYSPPNSSSTMQEILISHNPPATVCASCNENSDQQYYTAFRRLRLRPRERIAQYLSNEVVVTAECRFKNQPMQRMLNIEELTIATNNIEKERRIILSFAYAKKVCPTITALKPLAVQPSYDRRDCCAKRQIRS